MNKGEENEDKVEKQVEKDGQNYYMLKTPTFIILIKVRLFHHGINTSNEFASELTCVVQRKKKKKKEGQFFD